MDTVSYEYTRQTKCLDVHSTHSIKWKMFMLCYMLYLQLYHTINDNDN